MGSGSSETEFDEGRSERFEISHSASEYASLSGISCDGDRHSYDGAVSSLYYSSLVGPEVALNSSFRVPLPVTLPVSDGERTVVPPQKLEKDLSEVELIKERFAKLLLGEDMSGRGNGTCSALAISNSITNLSATVFGELWKLEPLAPWKMLMWQREMELLVCVSDSIVELIPSVQGFPGGGEGTFEVMVTRARSDIRIKLPALQKADAMLLRMLDEFSDSEFYYVERGVIASTAFDCEMDTPSSPSRSPSIRQEEKWWLPFPKVPPEGLSEGVTNRLQHCKELTREILKATMAINSSVLAQMEIPDVYLNSLPKSGRACLGETIYRYITADQFSSEWFLDCLDLSSEYTALEVANRVEAALHVWRQRHLKMHMNRVKGGKSSWGGKVKGLVGCIEKHKLLAQRAETILEKLRLRFPGLPQTALDIAKIQHNKDVGHSILESYSMVMGSLAFNMMARMEDLLYIDDATKARAAAADTMSLFKLDEYMEHASPMRRQIVPSSPLSIQSNTRHSSELNAPPSYSSAIDKSRDGNPPDGNLQDLLSEAML